MRVTVHGSRGSIPTPSKHTVKYGGDTSCFELLFDGYQIFFDTGSGFKNILLADHHVEKFIFYSHWHHDHIQGLPFNSHIFNQENKITVSSALASRNVLRHTLQTYFSGGYFPVDVVKTLSNLMFKNISAVKKSVDPNFKLDWLELQHPGGCYGYSVTNDDKKFCYLCDNEYDDAQFAALNAFTSGADMVIWDGMYTKDELGDKAGWGHSSIEQGIKFFKDTDIKAMMITHHAPFRTDDMLDDMQAMLPKGVQFAKDQLSLEF